MVIHRDSLAAVEAMRRGRLKEWLGSSHAWQSYASQHSSHCIFGLVTAAQGKYCISDGWDDGLLSEVAFQTEDRDARVHVSDGVLTPRIHPPVRKRRCENISY
jgi:hypothetical protein